MSNFNSTQYAKVVSVPNTPLRPDELGGRDRTLYAEYTTPSSSGPAAGDALILGKLPSGARVLSMEVLVPASFVTSSAKIGYGTIAADGTVTVVDDDRWGSGIDLSTVGRKQFLTVPADMDYRTTSEVAVVLTFTTGNPAASKQISARAVYSLD